MRTFTTDNLIIKQYVQDKEKYTAETEPIVKEMDAIQTETEEIMAETKKKLEVLTKKMSTLNDKQMKSAESFYKKKKKAIKELRKLELSNRAHKYEQLTNTENVNGEIVCTMVDVLETKTKELQDTLDAEEKKRTKDIPV